MPLALGQGKMDVPAHGSSRCLVVVSKHHATGNPWAHLIHTRCTCNDNSRDQSKNKQKCIKLGLCNISFADVHKT